MKNSISFGGAAVLFLMMAAAFPAQSATPGSDTSTRGDETQAMRSVLVGQSGVRAKPSVRTSDDLVPGSETYQRSRDELSVGSGTTSFGYPNTVLGSDAVLVPGSDAF